MFQFKLRVTRRENLTNKKHGCRITATMVSKDREPRTTPILSPDEQTVANELFDRAVESAHGQLVLLGGRESAVVTVKKRGRKGSMEVFVENH